MSVYEHKVDNTAQTLTYTQQEKHIYGSSRVGMDVAEKDMITPTITEQSFYRESGKKQYELSNHLGNVLTVITDKKQAVESTTTTGTVDYFVVEILSANDYSPFGVLLQNRNFTSEKYRYGFNGQEKDDEVKGSGNSYNYTYRMHDPRLGRFLSVDPMTSKYPHESPYIFVGNSPLMYVDEDGLEKVVVTGGEYTDAKRYKYNFVEPAIKQIKAYKAVAGTEQVTWAVMNVGYSEKAIKKMERIAKRNGVEFVLLNSADELTNYMNSKGTSSSQLSEQRKADQVTDVTIFGHGFAGSMEFGYKQGAELQEKFSYGVDDAKKLDPGAFNNACIDIFTCNAGTPATGSYDFATSLVGEIANQTKSKVSGYWGRTDYAGINTGEGYGDKWDRWLNDFNTEGSQRLPGPGNKMVDGQTYPSTKVTIERRSDQTIGGGK
jgi:RHS repeat-associated protein